MAALGTVYRVRERFVEQSVDAALSEEPRLGSKRMLDEKQEAILVGLACSPAPKDCPPDPERPVVCIDETLKQLVADVRERLPQVPGSVEKYDYHYRRNGTANLFVMTDRHRCWRRVKVTDHKTPKEDGPGLSQAAHHDRPDARTAGKSGQPLSIAVTR